MHIHATNIQLLHADLKNFSNKALQINHKFLLLNKYKLIGVKYLK